MGQANAKKGRSHKQDPGASCQRKETGSHGAFGLRNRSNNTGRGAGLKKSGHSAYMVAQLQPALHVSRPYHLHSINSFLSVIMLTEIQELLHATVYITSSSPDHTCLRMNLRDKRDTCNFGKEREHILIEETAAAALLHEL